MKRVLTFAVALLFAVISIQAQKIDARLTELLPGSNKVMSANGASQSEEIDTAAVKQEISVKFNSDGTVRSFSAFAMVKEGYAIPTAKLQALGIKIREEIGRMLILTIPAESLLPLGEMEEIESISADEKVELTNNNGREKSKVTEVATLEKAQLHGLPQAYTGKGVMVGVVDGGIDYNHAAFRNADGSTRVKLAIFYTGEDGDICNEYTKGEDIATLRTDDTSNSHGTHVAGTAAGSIIEGLNRQGMAPEADIMLAGLGSEFTQSKIMQSIKRMFDFAKEQNKPCVVNLSLGSQANFHDGKTLPVLKGLREYYDTEEKKKGKIVVFSSSNNNDHQAALYNILPAADAEGYNLKTVLGQSKYITYNGTKGVSCYTNINNFFYNLDGSELDVDVFVVDVTTGKRYTLEEKPLYKSGKTNPRTNLRKIKDVDVDNNKHYVRYRLAGTFEFHEPNLKLAYFVKSAEGKTLRSMENRKANTSGYYSYNLPGYTDGQDNGAFNVNICTDQVIGVGAYVSEYRWINITGEQWYNKNNMENGKIAKFSSWGVDDNGVNHPDVIAPGLAICSAYNLYDTNYFNESGQYYTSEVGNITNKVTMFNRFHYYGKMQGTSMAAPNATGTIALWLQAKPDMTYADVRNLIKETSFKDEYVTNPEKTPSKNVIQAGAGKIDALAGLKKLVGPTAVMTVEADGFRQATPATMYDVDDNCYNTLGQRVSKNAKGMVIYKGKVYMNR